MSHQERRGPPPSILIPELAESHPEAYKSALFDSLKNETKLGEQAWEKICSVYGIDRTVVSFRPDTWISETKNQHIYLGTKSMEAEEKAALMFEGEIFTATQEMVYRFNHEISHLISPNLGAPLQKFNTIAIQMRTHNPKRGLSALGSLDFYTTPKDKALEDVVEMVNGYIIDPDYLQRYLEFISSKDNTSVLETRGLAYLDPAAAEVLYKMIMKQVNLFLDK